MPHIHAIYQGQEIILALPEATALEGNIQKNKLKLVEAWIEIHKDGLMADWELAIKGEQLK